MDERTALLAFSAIEGIGIKRVSYLKQLTGSYVNAWNADFETCRKIEMAEKSFSKFDTGRKNFHLDTYLQILEQKQIHFLTILDDEYPSSLKQTPDAPFVLYLKGNTDLLKQANQIAVVGTRKTSSYGREITQKISSELAASGMTIVSGLALGVDAIAHKAALDAHGSTIAVLGCGIDCCFPRENQRIYDQILQQNSLIVSEYPLSQPANQGTFPARNRIIAGLSLGVLVTEAAADSGSLITANYAKKYDRMIFSIPGPITAVGSVGTTQLLKQGAQLITSAKEIIDALNIKPAAQLAKNHANLSSDEQKIVESLAIEDLSIDEIIQETHFPITQIMSLLSNLELKGIITNSGHKYHLN